MQATLPQGSAEHRFGEQKCTGGRNGDGKFLTIDHINGGGLKHRRETVGGSNFYHWIVRVGYPADLQTLCYNCNCGRQRNGGICPHLTESPRGRKKKQVSHSR